MYRHNKILWLILLLHQFSDILLSMLNKVKMYSDRQNTVLKINFSGSMKKKKNARAYRHWFWKYLLRERVQEINAIYFKLDNTNQNFRVNKLK